MTNHVKYECSRCGFLDPSEVHEIIEKDYEPYGDGYAERVSIILECDRCGSDSVEEIPFFPGMCLTCLD